jgi:hypothetical protein
LGWPFEKLFIWTVIRAEHFQIAPDNKGPP